MTHPNIFPPVPNRRAFLRGGTLFLATAAAMRAEAGWADDRDKDGGGDGDRLKIGLVTDLHYADKDPAINRYYRETPEKLAEAAEKFGERRPSVIVELGDFIDSSRDVETDKRFLKRINEGFSAIADDRHYVLGNHCVETLTKDEFLGGVGQERSYYSFDRGGFHFVILDACFRSDLEPYGRENSDWRDANIPPDEVDWLREDLKATDKKTVVFIHQRLDVENNYGVKNAPQVRSVLEDSGKVLAVLQGHYHRNDLKTIGGVPYCTLVAMIEGTGPENNGYSVLELAPDGSIRLEGFRKQESREWRGD